MGEYEVERVGSGLDPHPRGRARIMLRDVEAHEGPYGKFEESAAVQEALRIIQLRGLRTHVARRPTPVS